MMLQLSIQVPDSATPEWVQKDLLRAAAQGTGITITMSNQHTFDVDLLSVASPVLEDASREEVSL